MHCILFVSLILIGIALFYLGRSITSDKKITITKRNETNRNKKSIPIPPSKTANLPSTIAILFEAGMSNLKPESILRLEEMIEWIINESRNDSNIVLHITGSADSSGNLSRNKILAKERSIIVKNYIQSKLQSTYQINTKNISILVQPILVQRGNTPRERELLRCVEVSFENFL